MENKHKHLEFIQAIINRMAGNSFLLKGWAVTLVAALFALSAKDTNSNYILIAYFPVIIFWILDGYFLSQERLFIALYNHVRKLSEKEIDFSMNIDEFKNVKRNSYAYSMFSTTLIYFYSPLIIVLLVIMYFIH